MIKQQETGTATAAFACLSWRRSLRGIIGIVATAVVRLQRRVLASSYRRRAERELQSLPDATLTDIGVARSEIPWLALTQSNSRYADPAVREHGRPHGPDRRHERAPTHRFSHPPQH